MEELLYKSIDHTDLYETIIKTLTKKRRVVKYYVEVPSISIETILELLTYIDSLHESVEYTKETKVKTLNFD